MASDQNVVAQKLIADVLIEGASGTLNRNYQVVDVSTQHQNQHQRFHPNIPQHLGMSVPGQQYPLVAHNNYVNYPRFGMLNQENKELNR